MNDPDSVFIAGRHAVQGIGLSSPMCAEIPSESEKNLKRLTTFSKKRPLFGNALKKTADSLILFHGKENSDGKIDEALPEP